MDTRIISDVLEDVLEDSPKRRLGFRPKDSVGGTPKDAVETTALPGKGKTGRLAAVIDRRYRA